jgi:hypothetical protein
MSSNKFELKLKAYVNGQLRTPTKIAWIQGNDECLVTPCYEENGELVIKLIPDCVGNACVEGYVFFEDTCSSCEPEYFKRCFCNTDADCPDCTQCDENYGICVDLCKAGEFCKDDTCVECDENTPCPNNLICINGHCECPPNMFREGNRCVECNSSTNLGKCYECINGVITPKCDKACIENTGECVECVGSGDCLDRTDGKNCCNDNQCTCCNGFEWDNNLKQCVPSCNENTCDECERCTKDGCQPIQCPEGYKCYKGDCVYWPCESTSCDNGADCGPECGCVEFEGVKQCVPCYILECEGLCAEALGCKCNPNTSKCESSDKCNQSYCDGENPCEQDGCTCYDNKCVDCSNFPCIEEGGCNSYADCGCNEAGDCVGKDCSSDLKLVKEEACDSSTGCKLKATIPAGACKCDPIIFKVENTNTCYNGNTFILNLKTTLYKKVNGADIPYSAYKTSPYFADNELVSTYIRATVDYEYYMNGKFYSYNNVNIATLPNSGIVQNVINNLVFNGDHIKKSILVGGVTYPTRVTVKIFADGTKVQNANCTNYDTPVKIAEYVLNYSTAAAESDTCSKLNTTYKTAQVTSIVDDKSVKKPRFTWFRSSTATFSDSKFVYDGTYEKNGWFRKAFGTLVGDKWVDEINNPEKFEINSKGELLANYNYMVKSDCGCGSKVDTLEKVSFCCPKDFNYTIDACKREIKINAFTTCAVNDTLPTSYNISPFSQVRYKLKVQLDNGTEVVTLFTKAGITKTYDYAIVSASIVQGYDGGLLAEDESCVLLLAIPAVNLPEPNITVDCDNGNKFRVTFDQTSPLTISKVEIYGNDVKLTPELFSTTPGRTALYNKELGGNDVGVGEDQLPGSRITRLRARVTFSNGCIKTVDLTPCAPSVTSSEIPSGAKSRKNCSASGQGVTVETETFGFNTNQPINFNIEGGDLTNPISNTTGTFTNLGAGTYTITATQGTVSEQTTVVVYAATEPQVTLNPSSICPGETSILTITAPPGSQFSVMGPTGSIPVPAIPGTGVYSITGLTAPGGYTVTSIVDNPDICHVFEWSSLLTIGGQVLNPVINSPAGSYCVNTPIEITISDGVGGKTYNIVATSGNVTNQAGDTVSQMISDQSYFYTPTSITGNTVQIISIDSNCDTLLSTPVVKTFTGINPAPTISNVSVQCNNGLYNISATVTTTSGTITSVVIANVVATNVGSTYSVTGVPGTGGIIATGSNGCIAEYGLAFPINCNCPQATLTITGPATPLCGDQLITLSALPQLNPNIATGAWTYQWYDAGPLNCNNCTPTPIGAQGSWGTQPVELVVNASGSGSYFLKVTNNLNPECTYTSNTYSYTVDNPPATPIIQHTPTNITVGNSVTFNTGYSNYTNYKWYLNGGTNPVSTSSTYTFTPTLSGNYTISVIVSNGNALCTATSSDSFEVTSECNKIGIFNVTNPNTTCPTQATVNLTNPDNISFDWEIVAVNEDTISDLVGLTGSGTGNSFTFNLTTPNTDPGEDIDNISFVFSYTLIGNENCIQTPITIPWDYTRCDKGPVDLMLDNTSTWRDFLGTDYTLSNLISTETLVFLTDITINTKIGNNTTVSNKIYSNPGSGSGEHEYRLYHDHATTGCTGIDDNAKFKSAVDSWFGNSRTVTSTIGDLVITVQNRLNAIPILAGIIVSNSSGNLRFSNVPCEVQQIVGTVFFTDSTDCTFTDIEKKNASQYVTPSC